ncbi:hypothetical protein GJ744_000107 [Endocarpon pusillum]|uniref:Uncharacterized protein n=1 Tax=Endocarpon pusillum TaxID=364733 RepID=A0A8H7ATZ4_9EURO|nr:hypothetical protein GJ744_000107 [Endocarpon pusillum]
MDKSTLLEHNHDELPTNMESLNSPPEVVTMLSTDLGAGSTLALKQPTHMTLQLQWEAMQVLQSFFTVRDGNKDGRISKSHSTLSVGTLLESVLGERKGMRPRCTKRIAATLTSVQVSPPLP